MKKQDKNKMYIGIFIVFLMVSSTLGYLYGSEDSKKTNGYKFSLTDKGWQVYVDNQYWYFDYLPNDLNFESNIGQITSKVFVVMDDSQYFYELSSKFALLGVIVEKIDLGEEDCNSDFSTLIFTYKNDNKIYKDNKCVYFEGNTNVLIDRLFYEALGVI
jgi:hypothetical protein